MAYITPRTLGTNVALVTLRTRRTWSAWVTHRTLESRIALRTLGTLEPGAIEHRAGSVTVHILGGEVAGTVGVGIPALESIHAGSTLGTLRPRRTRITLRALGPSSTRVTLGTQRTRWACITLRALRPSSTLRALRTDEARRTFRTDTI